MTWRERRTEIYWARVAARRCIDCNAGLQDADRRRCLECAEAARDRSRVYRQEFAAQNLAAKRRYRVRQLAEGLCAICPRPVAPGRTQCDVHLVNGAARTQRYLDRRDAARKAG